MIRTWWRRKKWLRQRNSELAAQLEMAEERYEALRAKYVRLDEQYDLLIGIPLGELQAELARIKQELGIIKGMDNRADAESGLIRSTWHIMNALLAGKIPWDEVEKQRKWAEEHATALHELQQWTGEGQGVHFGPDGQRIRHKEEQKYHVKPQSSKRSDHG